jgi:hypothetical protein
VTWHAVKTLYEHDRGEDSSLFEERIVLFSAPNANAAADMAREEARNYLQANPNFRGGKVCGIFVLGKGDGTFQAREVWSLLLRSTVSFDDYVSAQQPRIRPPKKV